ncbi:hypothetical protein QYE76_063854 [Lolium multiflorum]|uniref:Uncharacterized protein n=1 Tax=Lolium multiflorum TaxID=4521 RepID=A0AAD8S5R3_LOLMU|nr:hypothetical protein QYE76_063854 [Lolium multiflorum]
MRRDNAGCFADRPFPGGSIISFGGHDVYVATVAPPRYPRQVLRCASPPPRAGASSAPANPAVVQVMMAGEEPPIKNPRTRGPNLERNVDPNASGSGPKAPPPPSRLDEVRAKLSSPLTAGGDTTTVEADLEAHRQLLLQQADELATAKRQLAITRREYEHAHGFTPGGNNPSRAGMIRRRGGGLGRDRARRHGSTGSIQGATPEQTKDPGMVLLKLLTSAPPQQHQGPPRDTAESAARAKPAQTPATHAVQAGQAARQAAIAAAAGHHQAGTKSVTPSRRRQGASTGRLPSQPHSPAGTIPAGPRIEPTDARDRLDRLVESRIARRRRGLPQVLRARSPTSPCSTASSSRDTPKHDGTASGGRLRDYSTAKIPQATRWRCVTPRCRSAPPAPLNNLRPAASTAGLTSRRPSSATSPAPTAGRSPKELEMQAGPDEKDRGVPDALVRDAQLMRGRARDPAISFFWAAAGPTPCCGTSCAAASPSPWPPSWPSPTSTRREEAGKAPADPAPAPSRRDHHKSAEHKPADGASHGSRRDNYRGKRHSDQPDRRYGSAHVAAVRRQAAAAARSKTGNGSRTRGQDERRSLEVNAVIPPVHQYLNWSEQAITFDRRDTPAILPKPGSYAMVLDPTIGTTRRSVRFSRVLIDGGSSINILYRDTARKLGIQEAELRPTPTVFHGIVPGHCCQPIGRITLEVMFGKPDHFRTEKIEFEVVDLVVPTTRS